MTVAFCALVAIAAVIIGCIFAWRAPSLAGAGAPWLTRLVMLNVVVVLPVSGLVHMTKIDGVSRGFYDLMTHPDDGALVVASLISLVCVLGFIIGSLWSDARCKSGSVPGTGSRSSRRTSAVLLIAALVLTPVCLTANRVMASYAESAQLARIITVGSGDAISYYLATWLPWVVTFIALVLLAGTVGRSPLLSAAVTGGAVAIMTAGLLWTGGRTLALVMALPLVVVALPRLRGLRPVFLGVGVVGAAALVWTVTRTRVGSRSDLSSGWSWVDWQWGRFSMVGFSRDYVASNGLLWGETLANAVVTPLQAVASLLGSASLAGLDYRSAVELTAYQITNQAGATYVVPGMIAEFYLNFGWAGVIAGSVLLGYWTRSCDRRIYVARDDVEKLWWAYVGGLLLLRTFASDTGAFVGYLLFTGAPVLGVYFLTRAWASRVPNRPRDLVQNGMSARVGQRRDSGHRGPSPI